MTSENADAYLEVDNLVKYFGDDKAVDGISFGIPKGAFLTLLGPSGCGKTTTLMSIAGLHSIDGGRIRVGETIFTSPQEGLFLPPEKRDIGMVFQSYAVWPHMTVFDNVAYGLRVRRASGAEIKSKTMRALELVGLDHLADRFATKLSGGQRQRVALARAIVYEPDVILFDEPLSNLDAKLREQMRDEIVRLQKEVGITSIFVTHDQSEALVMSDRVVVMDKAVIQQIGDPEDIYANPVNSFVANFIGVTSLLEGKLTGRSGETCEVEVASANGGAPLRLRGAGAAGANTGDSVFLNLRPEDVQLHLEAPDASDGKNVIEGQVIDTIYLGSFLEGRVRASGHEIGIQIDHYENLTPDQTVWLTFQPEHGLCLTE